jgi:hypothetical protein
VRARPFTNPIHGVQGRIARHVGGVLYSPGEDDGDTGVHILALMDVHLANPDA